jgi:hypothetical protein
MKEFAIRNFGPDDPRSKTDYALGDINTTMIVTEQGRVIHLVHDTNTPRVKEHLLRVQGTKGVFNSHMDKIFIEGRSNRADDRNWRGAHEWEATDEYRKQFDSKLWQTMEARSSGAGHGGIDYMLIYRVIRNFQEGTPQDIDVYDAATWSVIVPLSEASVSGRSMPMDIPDFTRGKWKTRPPIDIDSIV